jgi:hypothetical protein
LDWQPILKETHTHLAICWQHACCVDAQKYFARLGFGPRYLLNLELFKTAILVNTDGPH